MKLKLFIEWLLDFSHPQTKTNVRMKNLSSKIFEKLLVENKKMQIFIALII